MQRLMSCTLLAFALFASEQVGLTAADAIEPVTPTTQAPAWNMPAAENQALQAVIERVIAAGFPDPKGGTFMHGTVSYKTTMRQGSSSHTRDNQSEGLHLRLADGRLLLNLRTVVPTVGDGAVDISKLETVAVDKLMELGAKNQRIEQWNVEQAEAQFKRLFAESELPKARAMMAIKELMILAQGNTNDVAIPALVMMRMQVPKAEMIAVACAMNSLWNIDGRDLFAGKDAVLRLMPVDQNAFWRERSQDMQKWKGLVLPEYATVLRQGAIGHFLSDLYVDQNRRWQQADSAITMTPEAAGKAANALIDDRDAGAASLRAQIKRYQERVAIPLNITADADLATMLTWWEETQQGSQNDQDDEGQDSEELLKHIAQMPAEQRQQFIDRVVMKRLRAVPLAELVAMAGDLRTSRWVDNFRVRTVGDNALRAVAQRLGCDPRVLFGRDEKALWSDKERSETIAALKTWWQANQGKPLAELVAGALGQMALPDIARLVIKADDKERGALLTDLAIRWATEPPKAPDPTSLARILVAAKAGKVLDAVVAKWPVAGRQRLLLAAWHQDHGNATHIDAVLAEALKPAAPVDPAKPAPVDQGADEDFMGNESPTGLRGALRLVARYPNADRLNRVMMAITAPAKGDDGSAMLEAVSSMAWGGEDALASWWGEDNNMRSRILSDDAKPNLAKRAQAAVPLVLMGLLLNDQRPASKALVDEYSQWIQAEEDDKKPQPPAADLRVADMAAVVFPNMSGNLPLEDLTGNDRHESFGNEGIKLSSDKTERDKAITMQRALIAAALPLALKAAALPTAIPGVTDVAPAATGADAPVF